MDMAQQTQLHIIHDVTTRLHAASIEHWLFGGWAIDFRLGAITRLHDDIEFLVWHMDASRIAELLVHAEYNPYSGGYVEEMAIFLRREQKLELDYLTHTATGQVVVTGRWADWAWPDGAFDAPPATLAGITCPTISAEGLLAIKEGYAKHPAGGPLREKDRVDMQRLRMLLQQS